MKVVFLIGVLALAFFSCKKPIPETCEDGIKNQNEVYSDCGGVCSPCPIDYPENGNIGPNLLYGQVDTLDIISSNYTFKAEVPTGSSLQVKMTTLSGDMWLYGTNNGWSVGTPGISQVFEVITAGTADIIINLTNTSGSALIEYFENGSSVTQSRVVIWG